MRGLLAVLYLIAVGWAISHYELDRLALEAARKQLRGLMAEHAQISLEVYRAAAAPPLAHWAHWEYSSARGLDFGLVVSVPVVLPYG